MLPFLEGKGSVPFGIARGLSPFHATAATFVGTCILIPVLLNIFLPAIEMLKKTKVLSKFGFWLENRAECDKKTIKERYKYISLFLFVATPLPGTGVYGGCLLAAILGLNKFKAGIALVLGNLAGCIEIYLVAVGVIKIFS